MRFKRAALGCAPLDRGASAPLAEFDIVAPAAALEDAVLLAALSLGLPDLAATGTVARAAAKTRLGARLAAFAAVRANVSDTDWRALQGFNPCAAEVYGRVQRRYAALMAQAGETFSAIVAVERRRRTEAEVAAGAAGAELALAKLEAGKG